MSFLLIILIAFFILTPKQLIVTAQKLGSFVGKLKKTQHALNNKLNDALKHIEYHSNIARAEKAENSNVKDIL
ncbi:MAG: hypothetical protein AB7F64_03655 [Gammaproteobacteria bacterium]